MWNFGFAEILNTGIPVLQLDALEPLRPCLDIAVWLFIVAGFGFGLSCLRGAVTQRRDPSAELPRIDPESGQPSDGSDLGRAA